MAIAAVTSVANDTLDLSAATNLQPQDLPSSLDQAQGLAAQDVVNQVNSDYNFLNRVMQSSNLDSLPNLATIQEKIVDFNVATSLVSKTAAIIVKDVDTLTKLQ